MTAGVQPGPCKSNAISHMCGGKRVHACKFERWMALVVCRVGQRDLRLVAWRNCFISQMMNEGVQALWWGRELIRVHKRSSNWA